MEEDKNEIITKETEKNENKDEPKKENILKQYEDLNPIDLVDN